MINIIDKITIEINIIFLLFLKIFFIVFIFEKAIATIVENKKKIITFNVDNGSMKKLKINNKDVYIHRIILFLELILCKFIFKASNI